MNLPTLSSLKIEVSPDQSVSVVAAGIRVEKVEAAITIPGQPVRDWLAELDLPKNFEKLEAMAKPRGYSGKRISFILGDESPTHFPGNWRQHPQTWTYADGGHALTLAHTPFVIGICQRLWRGRPSDLGAVGESVLGDCLLYDSDLADAALKGIQLGIFIGVSPILIRPTSEPPGGGHILEIGLTDQPVCPGARILRCWDWFDETLRAVRVDWLKDHVRR